MQWVKAIVIRAGIAIKVIESWVERIKVAQYFLQAFSIFNADLRPAIWPTWVFFVWTYITLNDVELPGNLFCSLFKNLKGQTKRFLLFQGFRVFAHCTVVF